MNPSGFATAPPIVVRELRTQIAGQPIHEGLDLVVERGEILGLVGGSGSGKSVLLKAIIGLLPPEEGEIRVFGTDIYRDPENEVEAVKRRWGVLFQANALFSTLTARENIQVPLRQQMHAPDDMLNHLALVKALMAGLPADAIDKYPNELSGGMQKRTGLARAIARDPELLILDEPTSGLDPVMAAQIDALIHGLAHGLGLTVLLVTHDKKELAQANYYNGAALAPGLGKKSWNNLSWLGSLTYRFSPEVLAYARISTAYRAGGFDAGGSGVPNGYDPEKVISYEAGIKTDLLDRRLRINLSGYITDYKDLQISQFTAGSNGGGTRTVNAGKVTFSGFEAEMTAVLTDFLTIDGSLGYVHPNYKTYLYRDPATDQLINVADEVHLAHVSKKTARVGVAWDIAKWADMNLLLRVDYSYKSSAPTFPLDRVSPFNPYIRRSAENELSARLTLKDIAVGDKLKLTIQAYGDNLLNEKRAISAVDFGSLGFATHTWGPTRQGGIIVTASY